MLAKLRREIIDHIGRNARLYLGLIIAFVVGICAGAFTVNGLGGLQAQELKNYVEGFLKLLGNQELNNAELFKRGFVDNIKVAVLLWILGVTIIGIPFIFIAIGIRGFIIGFSAGFISSAFGIQGVIFILLTVIPKEIIILPSILCLGVSGINFSLSIIKRRKHAAISSPTVRSSLASYLLLGLFLIGLISGGVLVEAYISSSLAKLIMPIMIN
jgi:stage II sporulation protein M